MRVSANMVVAESRILEVDPKYRRCYLSKEKPLAYFKYYTQVQRSLHKKETYLKRRKKKPTYDVYLSSSRMHHGVMMVIYFIVSAYRHFQ